MKTAYGRNVQFLYEIFKNAYTCSKFGIIATITSSEALERVAQSWGKSAMT